MKFRSTPVGHAAVTQLTLPGFDAPPPAPVHRFFFAVMPDTATAARIAGVAKSLQQQKDSPVGTERLHITLGSLGDFAYVPGATLARARAVADRMEVPSFSVRFDKIISFNRRSGRQPLVLTGKAGLEDLIDFRRQLRDALKRVGVPVFPSSFTPHVTLLYGAQRPDEYRIEPITWTVFDFVLIDSWLGKSHYDVLGRWPLTTGSSSG
ncbi:2'-5' RNA ligase family protein [Burkholderia cenocepacia]|uniref:2'-5' RNA ligase family protein n=1 Tax=Burkholderia cenocepacia TaxID=95486 RepID=UPI001B970562|nr:2'-5' RNA ligase family protein [Burkholderia cenocepacia]MBR8071156.1 2'-5' RNA ligase family protein [Burkholderia cenocepacia]MBR8446633.1 2'-5' RNA ligase family protein [Burkholderia cenocepacia]